MTTEGSVGGELESEGGRAGAAEAAAEAHDAVDIGRLPPLTLAEALERYRFEGPVDEAKVREEWQDEAAKDVMGR